MNKKIAAKINKILYKLGSVVTISAFVFGGMSYALGVPRANANNGIFVSAVPSAGTLTVGSNLEVYMTIPPESVDPNDLNPVIADSCMVNNVETKNTFIIISSGHFKVTYTVGAGDTSRTAGNIPFNCTLHQTNSVTMTAFDDGNTVGIDTSVTPATLSSISITTPATKLFYTVGQSLDIAGLVVTGTYSDSSTSVQPITAANITGFNSSVPATDQVLTITVGGKTATYTVNILSAASNNAILNGTTPIHFPTITLPGSGTLIAGQTLEVRFTDSSGSINATSISCLVNNVNIASTFQNIQPGFYKATYTVAGGHTNRTAGNIPIDCILLGDINTVRVTAFSDNNTVAVNANVSPIPVQPSISMTAISPSAGMIHSGDVTTVTFTEANSQSDLVITGACMINAVSVVNSFQNMNNGTYRVTYTVGANEGERPAGHIPITCRLGNSAGNTTTSDWLDGNTLSIDTNNDGIIDNGTNNLGFTISASPSSGTLGVGGQMVVSMQNPLPSADVVIGASGCRVNGVDVSSTYGHHGNGLYQATYTVGASDASRAAGQIPFDCRLQNATGSVHLVAFTDNNTVVINTGVPTPTLSSIAITTPATKLSYTVGQTLDIAGLVVTGTYNDNSTLFQPITLANITGFNSTVPATNQVLTITVGGKTATYTVNVVAAAGDTTRPIIILNGVTADIQIGGSYTELGATANDNVDGSFAANPSGSVNTNAVGTYTITYNATDTAGNIATPITRSVNVVPLPSQPAPVAPIAVISGGGGGFSSPASYPATQRNLPTPVTVAPRTNSVAAAPVKPIASATVTRPKSTVPVNKPKEPINKPKAPVNKPKPSVNTSASPYNAVAPEASTGSTTVGVLAVENKPKAAETRKNILEWFVNVFSGILKR